MDEDYWKDMLMVGTSIPVAEAVGRPMKGSDVFFPDSLSKCKVLSLYRLADLHFTLKTKRHHSPINSFNTLK